MRFYFAGFSITGIDLASSSIQTARKPETRGLRFYVQDMRLPFGTNQFDYVFNFFPSFGYFKTVEEKEIDGMVYHLTRWTDDRNFYKRITIDNKQAEASFVYLEQVAEFSLSDFDYLCSCHGLHLKKAYGNYHLNRYDFKNSPRLILIAKKDNNAR